MNNDRPDRCVTQQAQFMVADKRYKKTQREINTRSGLTLCLDIILFYHSAWQTDINRYERVILII